MNKLIIATAGAAFATAFEQVRGVFLDEPQDIEEDAYQTSPINLSSATGCQFYTKENFSWYSFIDTSSSGAQYFTANGVGTSHTAYFTYCQNLSGTSAPECATNNFATIVSSDGSCGLNTQSITGEMSTYNGDEVFTLNYNNGDSSTNGGVSNLYVYQKCSSDMTTVDTGALTETNGSYYTEQTSSTACPIFTANGFVQFIDEYSWFFGIGFIVIGFFFAFLGRKVFNVTLFIITALIVCGLVLFIFYATCLEDNTKSWVGWLMLSLSVVLGLLAGYLMVKLEKFGAALVAGWGGFCLGVILNETVLYLVGSAALQWCVNIGLAIICAILAFVLLEPTVICATAFIGSYMVMRGIGFMAGGFPNEYVLINEIEAGAIDNIPAAFYGYLVGIVILTILSAIVQFKMYNKAKEENGGQHPYSKLN